LRTTAKALALVAVLGAVAFGVWYGLRQVWFLGTDQGGRVALYRGLPYELPFGVKLYNERYSAPLQTESLPERRRESVTGHDLRSREDAVSLIEDLEASQWPKETAPPQPKPSAKPEKGNTGK
jgi:protein phosphatase